MITNIKLGQFFFFFLEKRETVLLGSTVGCYPVPDWGSVKSGQSEELRLEVLHAPESQRGLPGKVGVEVVVRYHHRLHSGSQRRLHTAGSVFKHQALSRDEGKKRKTK